MSLSATNPVPERQSILPYLMVRDAARALDFYVKALGARERVRLADPDGRIAHAELELEGNQVWLADEAPELGCPSPETLGGTAAMVYAHVADVGALTARALAAGATLLRPPTDQFWGSRTATLRDPFGHVWTLATVRERMTREQAIGRARWD
jgi:PhnB protein